MKISGQGREVGVERREGAAAPLRFIWLPAWLWEDSKFGLEEPRGGAPGSLVQGAEGSLFVFLKIGGGGELQESL